MTSRLNLLRYRWSTRDVPVLPFLAPSVFEPWPIHLQQDFRQKRTFKKRAGHVRQSQDDSTRHCRFAHSISSQRLDDEHDEFSEKHNVIGSTSTFTGEKSYSATKQREGPISQLHKSTQILDKFPWTFGQWNRRFTALPLWKHKCMLGVAMLQQVIYDGRPTIVELPDEIRTALIQRSSTAAIRQLCYGLDMSTRSILWSEIMMTAMEHYPDAALNFLEATYQHPYPPAFAVSDCLDYIIAHQFSDSAIRTPSEDARFVKRIRTMLYLGAQERVHLRQQSIHRIICNSSLLTNTRFYTTLGQVKHRLHENTFLQFASHMSKTGPAGTMRALNVMGRMRNTNMSINTAKALSVFTTMLDREDRGPDARELDSKILQFMLENGASPNVVTYNILIKNNFRDGTFDTAWRIFGMMKENGIEPTADTFSTLLNDSKKRMDAERIKQVVSIVRDTGIRDAFIVTDILHAIFLLQRDQDRLVKLPQRLESERQPAFSRMLGVYSEHFHIQPLQLILPDIASANHTEDITQLMNPDACVLVVMLTAYLAQLPTSMGLKRFYDHFLGLLSAGNTIALSLAQEAHFWCVIIMNFSRFDDSLAFCPEVVGLMLHNKSEATNRRRVDLMSPDPLLPEYSAQLEVDTHPPLENSLMLPETTQSAHISGFQGKFIAPNVYTWTILLKVFMDHQQPRAAEKVLEMMTERGIEPNMVTWNTLLSGYTRMQATLDAVNALGRMGDAGFKPDDITMQILDRLDDKRMMLTAMGRNEAVKTERTKDTGQLAIEDDETLDSDTLTRTWDQIGGSFEAFAHMDRKDTVHV